MKMLLFKKKKHKMERDEPDAARINALRKEEKVVFAFIFPVDWCLCMKFVCLKLTYEYLHVTFAWLMKTVYRVSKWLRVEGNSIRILVIFG